MKFDHSFRISDLAMGLTVVAGARESDHAVLDGIQNMLNQETHETIFEKAREIALEYGSSISIEGHSHEEMFADAMQGFSVGETSKGWVCALWAGGPEGPIMPSDHSEMAHTCEPPEEWTVFRAYSLTVN